MSLMQYLHTLFTSYTVNLFNSWHIILPRDLHLIFTYYVFNQLGNWSVLLPRYLQTFVSVVVSADVTLKLSKDIYKTNVLQKSRKGLLKLNWTIPIWTREKTHPEFNKYSLFLGGFGISKYITARRHIETTLRRSKQCIKLRLKNICSPDWEMANMELVDIIDIRKVEYLMSDFYKHVPISLGLNDLKGNVLVGVGWQDICTKFHRVCSETCKYCVECNIKLSKASLPGEFKIYRCKNNMWDMAAPIMIDDRHIGDIYAGQFFFEGEPVDYNFFRSQARKQGFNEEEYIAALEKVPRLSSEALDKAIDFLLTFDKVLNYKYNRKINSNSMVFQISRYSFKNQILINEFKEDD